MDSKAYEWHGWRRVDHLNEIVRASDAVRVIRIHRVKLDLATIAGFGDFVNAQEVLDLERAGLETLPVSKPKRKGRGEDMHNVPVRQCRALQCGVLHLSR